MEQSGARPRRIAQIYEAPTASRRSTCPGAVPRHNGRLLRRFFIRSTLHHLSQGFADAAGFACRWRRRLGQRCKQATVLVAQLRAQEHDERALPRATI